MSAHTPGPWTLDPCASGWTLIANGQDITSEPFDACDADARLIAAAPELLDAARCALADLEGAAADIDPSGDRVHPVWLTINELRDAIERATGGAP